MTKKRPLRADARRNRERLLDVAQETFAKEGLQVPIDEIARRAGVGIGTVYRHFPTKEALFEAIVVGRLEAMLEATRRFERADDPGEAFFQLFARVIEEGAKKKDFFEALAGSGFDVKRVAGNTHRELRRSFGRLLVRAQEARAVRRDITIDELMALVSGAHSAMQHAASARARALVLEIVCDGLRPR